MKSGVILSLLAGTLAFSSGCTQLAKSRARTDDRLQEHSRAFTTGIVDALQLQPTDRRDLYTATALHLAQVDQRAEGLPLTPIDVATLIDPTGTNASGHAVAQSDMAHRESQVNALLARQRRTEDRLIAYGESFEAERNARHAAWFKRGSAITLIAGALIALFVFFPALIPVAGRLLAWAVARVPSIAGGAGVVSVKAFDALVKAIEQTRSSNSAPERFGNQAGDSSRYEDLFLNLSRAMDADHKALVRRRKAVLHLEQ